MAALIFGVFLLLGFVTVLLMLRPKKSEKAIEKRLKTISAAADGINELEGDGLDLSVKPKGGLADRLGEYLQRFDFSADLQLLILHAGSKTTVVSVVFGGLMTAAAAGFLMHAFVGVLPLDLVAVAAGGSVRWFLLKFQKSRRMKKFDTALPDAIELIARALRAGHSMASSIEVVAEQSVEPLKSEFAVVFQQQKFGIPFRDALLQLGDRVPSRDLHFLITAILVQKETGGDLTEILDRTTHVIRDRVRIEGEIKTYTAQGRLTGWILASLPVVLLFIINIASPGYSSILFHDPLGQDLLYTGATLIVIGGLIIRKIVNIKV
jgi:tight adherence protein B